MKLHFIHLELIRRYELPSGTFTFYYMELALEAKLQRKVNQLKEILTKSKGQIQYDWKAVQYIQSRYFLSPILCILCFNLCISYTVIHVMDLCITDFQGAVH